MPSLLFSSRCAILIIYAVCYTIVQYYYAVMCCVLYCVLCDALCDALCVVSILDTKAVKVSRNNILPCTAERGVMLM
jgi:hypothetical protein